MAEDIGEARVLHKESRSIDRERSIDQERERASRWSCICTPHLAVIALFFACWVLSKEESYTSRCKNAAVFDENKQVQGIW